jgi:hypothetical protein
MRAPATMVKANTILRILNSPSFLFSFVIAHVDILNVSFDAARMIFGPSVDFRLNDVVTGSAYV